MKFNLLTKSALTCVILSSLTACGGVDKGYDPEFGSDDAIVFENDMITASYDEDSGIQTIDLLQAASAGGVALTDVENTIYIGQMEITAASNFVTPQSDSNTITTHTISPFTLSEDSTQLIIDTDIFAESLRECDATDVRGARDADDNPIGDGFADNPTSATYEITYEINNGVELPAGTEVERRVLSLTINAVKDPVTGVIASAVELPAGGKTAVIASTQPAYACDSRLTYTVSETSIATVDEAGMLTGTSVGQTTVTATSVENSAATATADVNVTAAFSIAISNGAVDDLGAPTGLKEIPTCIAAGIEVTPSVINYELTGSYGYDWMSSNDSDVTFDRNVENGFGGIGVFKVGSTVGAMSMIDVGVATGDTGATPISEIEGKSITVTTVANSMCNTGVSIHPAGFNTDFNLDVSGAPFKGNATYASSTDTVSGSVASLQITGGSSLVNDDQPFSWAAQQVWNKQRHWPSWNYGRGLESVGRTFKYSVWVKLAVLPEADITLRHVVVPWITSVIPGSTVGGFSAPERVAIAGISSATLKATTQWQYIEFVNDKTDTKEWAIPGEWDIITDVFQLWEVYGLPQGQTILLDDYGVVEVK